MAKKKTALEQARAAYNKSHATKNKINTKTGKKIKEKKQPKAKSHYGQVEKKTRNTEQNRKGASVKKAVGSVKKSLTTTNPNAKKVGTSWGSVSNTSQDRTFTNKKWTPTSVARDVKKAVNPHKGDTVQSVWDMKKKKGETDQEFLARKVKAASKYNANGVIRQEQKTDTGYTDKDREKIAASAEKDLNDFYGKKYNRVKAFRDQWSEKGGLGDQFKDIYGREATAEEKKEYYKKYWKPEYKTQTEKLAKEQSKEIAKEQAPEKLYSKELSANESAALRYYSTKTGVAKDGESYANKALKSLGTVKYSLADLGTTKPDGTKVTKKDLGKVKLDKKGKPVFQKVEARDYQGNVVKGKNGKPVKVDRNIAEEVGSLTAAGANNAKFAVGFMQGSGVNNVLQSGVGEYNNAAKKVLTNATESGAFNAGYMGGIMAQFMGTGTAKVAEGLMEQSAKAATKSAGTKFAQNRLIELGLETPLNFADAVKMATDPDGKVDTKTLAMYMGLNSAMTVGMGGAIEGAGLGLTRANSKEFIQLQAKALKLKERGLKLSPEDMKRFNTLQGKLDEAGKNLALAKSSVAYKTNYNAKVAKDVFSETQSVDKAIKSMQGAGTHVEKMDYAKAIKDRAMTEFDELRTKRADTLAKIETASPEKAVELREEATALQKQMDHLANVANGADRQLQIETKKNKRALQDLTENVNKLSEKTGVKYRVVNDKDMRKLIAETGEDVSDEYFYKGFYYKNKAGETEILINSESPQAHQTVIGHETGHLIKTANEEEFKKLGSMLEEYAKKQKEYDEIAEQLKRSYPEATPDELQEEITCELLGRYVYGKDDKFIKQLAGEQPSVVIKVVDYLKQLFDNSTSKEMRAELKAIIDKTESLVNGIDSTTKAEKAKFAKNGNGDNPIKITAKMTDAERTNILSKSAIEMPTPNEKKIATTREQFEIIRTQLLADEAEETLKEIGEKFGIFEKSYYNKSLDFEFIFSKGGVHKSANKQVQATGDFEQLAKVLSCMKDVTDRAIPVEAHADRYVGTYRADVNHKQTYALISAMRDGDSVLPIELIVHERKGKQPNTLYVTVVLDENKKKTVTATRSVAESNGFATMSSDISVPELVKKINSKDAEFLKYLPDGMLSESQLEGKALGLKREAEELKRRREMTLDRIGKTRKEIEKLAQDGKDTKNKESVLLRLEKEVESHRSDYEADGLLKPNQKFSKEQKPPQGGSFDVDEVWGESLASDTQFLDELQRGAEEYRAKKADRVKNFSFKTDSKDDIKAFKDELEDIDWRAVDGNATDADKQFLLDKANEYNDALGEYDKPIEITKVTYDNGMTNDDWLKLEREAFDKDYKALEDANAVSDSIADLASGRRTQKMPNVDAVNKMRHTESVDVNSVKELTDEETGMLAMQLKELAERREKDVLENELEAAREKAYKDSLSHYVVKTSDYDIDVPEKAARYNNERIDNVINKYAIKEGKNKGKSQAYITLMNPDDFVRLTLSDARRAEWETGGALNRWDYDAALKDPREDAPHLYVDLNTGRIYGHEGRHRLLALHNNGIESVPVVIRVIKGGSVLHSSIVDAPMKNLELTGQVLERDMKASNGARVEVNDLIPASPKYKSEITERFGGEAKVKFSKETKPKTETPTETKPKETETQKLSENKYASSEVKTALKDIENAGLYKEEAERAAKKFNELDKKIGAETKHIENARKSDKYATEAEREARIAELEDNINSLKRQQEKVAGQIEQMGKMKAVDPNKTAEQQIRETRGPRKANKELKETDNLVNEDNWIKDKWNSVRRLWEDSLIEVENVAKRSGTDKTLREEIMTAANRVRNSMSVANQWVTRGRKAFDNKVGGKALDDIFTKELIENETKYADFQEYLVMKHVPARHAKGTDIYSDISPELATKRVGELEEMYGDEIKTFAKDVYDYLDDLQQYRVDSGMLSKEAADQFKKDYPFYIPTNRVNDESIDFFTGGMSNGIRSAKGGDSDVLDIYSQIYTATNKTIHAAEENQMLNLYFKAKGVTEAQLKNAELTDLEHAVIEANVNKKTGKANVSFFVDGKPVNLPCSHQLALGLRELDGLEFERLMKAAKVATLYGKPFKALVTDWNLVFGVRNGMRDLQQAVVNSKDTRYFGSSMGAAAHSIAHDDSPYRRLYASMGGEQAQLVSYDAVAKNMGIEKQGKVDAIHEKVQDWVDADINGKNINPIHYIEGINGAIEMMPRMCEFIGTIRKQANFNLKKNGSSLKQLRKEIIDEVDALEKAGKIGQTEKSAEVENRLAQRIIDTVDKDTIDSAMRNANDITLNFGRSGVLGKALNMGFVPYLNPSIQGLSKLIRLFTEAGGEGGAKALMSIGMKLGTFTIAPAVINELALKNNEDYQNLNTRDKDNNFFIPIGDGKFIKLPKPRENAVLAEPVEYSLRYFIDNSEYAFFDMGKLKSGGSIWDKIPLTDEGKQSIRTAVDNIGVINPATSNMFSPFFQTMQNKTWYGGSIESAYEIENKKSQDRYDVGTSWVAIQLGQTGAAKFFNLSPKKIDNLLDSYTGMLYDLGISQTTEEAKTRGNYLVRTMASQFMKDSVFSNKLSTKAWAKTDGMTKEQADKYKSTYMYDTFKYDDAMDLITSDKNMTNAEKMAAKRELQKKKNKLNREAIDGAENTSNPLVDIAKHLGANKTLNHFLPDFGDKRYSTWADYYKTYKKDKKFKTLSPVQKEREAKKFLDVYSLGVKGELKIDPAKYHDSPSWGMTGVAAAQLAKQGRLKGKDAKSIMLACGVYESQTNTYFKYADHGGNVSRYAVTQKNVNKTTDKLFDWGIDDKSGIWQNKFDKSKGAKGGILSMSLATGKADFKDRAYYIANPTDDNMLIKMNAARGYSSKYGHTTKGLANLALKADKDGNTYLNNDEIVETCNSMKKATHEEKAMAYVLLGGNPNKNPFGAIGDYSHDGDTGITADSDGKGGGGRRGHGGWGHGGGGGGGGKGKMPTTKSGAINGKVTDPFKTSNGTSASNLNDAYRKKAKKLRSQSRK